MNDWCARPNDWSSAMYVQPIASICDCNRSVSCHAPAAYRRMTSDSPSASTRASSRSVSVDTPPDWRTALPKSGSLAAHSSCASMTNGRARSRTSSAVIDV
jgi:hypothetical protein